MKEKIVLIIKGMVLGVANVIPGVSGGTLAITMGIYEELIDIISHFKKNIKKIGTFLVPIAIGAILSIILMSKVISSCLHNFPVPTTIFFIGLIIGGIPLLTKKIKHTKIKTSNIFIFLITFTLVIVMLFLKTSGKSVDLSNVNMINIIILFIVGVIASATMIIPGVSGSFILMLLGFYEPIVNIVGNITDFSKIGYNLSILVPFGLGVLIGIVLVARLIEFLLDKYEVATYYGILGFIASSIITLIIGLIGKNVTIMQIIVSIIIFVIALIIGYKLGDE